MKKDKKEHKGLWQQMKEIKAVQYPPTPEQLAAAIEEWKKMYTVNKEKRNGR